MLIMYFFFFNGGWWRWEFQAEEASVQKSYVFFFILKNNGVESPLIKGRKKYHWLTYHQTFTSHGHLHWVQCLWQDLLCSSDVHETLQKAHLFKNPLNLDLSSVIKLTFSNAYALTPREAL